MDKSLGAEAPPPWTSCRVSLRNGATVMDISERFLQVGGCRGFSEMSISRVKCPRDVHLDISGRLAAQGVSARPTD